MTFDDVSHQTHGSKMVSSIKLGWRGKRLFFRQIRVRSSYPQAGQVQTVSSLRPVPGLYVLMVPGLLIFLASSIPRDSEGSAHQVFPAAVYAETNKVNGPSMFWSNEIQVSQTGNFAGLGPVETRSDNDPHKSAAEDGRSAYGGVNDGCT